MILGLKRFVIVVVNHLRQHYVFKFNSFYAVQFEIIARLCFIIQGIKKVHISFMFLVIIYLLSTIKLI